MYLCTLTPDTLTRRPEIGLQSPNPLLHLDVIEGFLLPIARVPAALRSRRRRLQPRVRHILDEPAVPQALPARRAD